MPASTFDGVDLGIEQVADPAVGADFPPPPGDFPDYPGALADRREGFLQRQTIDGAGCGGSGLIDRPPDRDQCLGEPIVGGRLLLGGQVFFDPRHRIEHHAGVGIAVALGILAEKPAAPRRLHERFADRVIVLLARLGCASGNRR